MHKSEKKQKPAGERRPRFKALLARLRLRPRSAMPRGAKIVVGTLAALLGLAGMFLLALEARGQQPEHCAGCHPIEPYYESWRASEFEASAHSRVGVACFSCHPRTLGHETPEQVAFRTGNYRSPLKEAKVRQQVCLRCHGTYALLAERTAEIKPNPHKSHKGAVDCRLCHKMHKESVDYCMDCHTPEEFLPGGQYYEP